MDYRALSRRGWVQLPTALCAQPTRLFFARSSTRRTPRSDPSSSPRGGAAAPSPDATSVSDSSAVTWVVHRFKNLGIGVRCCETVSRSSLWNRNPHSGSAAQTSWCHFLFQISAALNWLPDAFWEKVPVDSYENWLTSLGQFFLRIENKKVLPPRKASPEAEFFHESHQQQDQAPWDLPLFTLAPVEARALRPAWHIHCGHRCFIRHQGSRDRYGVSPAAKGPLNRELRTPQALVLAQRLPYRLTKACLAFADTEFPFVSNSFPHQLLCACIMQETIMAKCATRGREITGEWLKTSCVIHSPIPRQTPATPLCSSQIFSSRNAAK